MQPIDDRARRRALVVGVAVVVAGWFCGSSFGLGCDSGAGGGSGGDLAAGEECEDDEECESGACGDESEVCEDADECIPNGNACGPSDAYVDACCSEYCGVNGTCE